MALAIGIAVHCDGCVAYHTKMAHQHGATREEVAEKPSTSVVDQRQCKEEVRCAHTISLTAQTVTYWWGSKKRGTQTAITPEPLIEAAHACRLRVNNLYQYEDGWHAKVNDGRPSGCNAEKHMATSEKRAVTVLLTDEHLRKMTEDHLLKENETGDRVKVARIVQKLLDTGLGLPDRPWHDWDEWVKGLE